MDITPGGLSEAKPADEEIQGFCDKVRGAIQAQTGDKFQEYRATLYKSQVVNGYMYYVKVKVCGTKYIHVKIFNPLPVHGDTPQLEGYQLNKTADDEIVYF